jgi:hypothetical protein
MAGDIAAAQELITAMGTRLDRAAVVRWAAIKERADGRERQAISWMSEAFYPLAKTEDDRRWLSSFFSGIPALVEEARQSIKQEGDPKLKLQARSDETDSKNAEVDASNKSINWANVASEVKTMLALNPNSKNDDND